MDVFRGAVLIKLCRASEASIAVYAGSGIVLGAFIDVVLILLAAFILLPQNLNWLFSNTDAELYHALDHVGREFGQPLLFTNINPVAVLGTLMSQLNPFLHPIHYLWYSTDNLAIPYVALAVLLYLATFALGQTLGYPTFVSRLAGYLMAVFWVPFFGPFSVDIMARIAPWTTYIVCVHLFAWSIFVTVGTRGRVVHDLLLLVLFCGTFAYAFLVEFSYAALNIPFSTLFLGAMLVSCASRREFAMKLAALATCLIVLVALDIGPIMSTATQLSVRAVEYAGHNMPVSIRSFLTSLLANDFYALTPVTLQAVPYLKGLALTGIAFGLCGFAFARQYISRRLFAVTLASAIGFFGLYVVSTEYMIPNVIWPWPAPVYFEWIAHPLYALSGLTALYFVVRTIHGGVSQVYARSPRQPVEQIGSSSEQSATDNGQPARPRMATWGMEVVLVVLVASVTGFANKVLPFDHKGFSIFDVAGVFPPAWVNADWITESLASQLSLRRDREYRGAFLSTLGDASVKRSYQMRNFVPMMTEYQRGDTLVTRAIRTLLDHPPLERQVQLLRLFGVKYVQYPKAVASPDLLLADDLPRATENGVGNSIFLYRVTDPNLVGYAPTRIERIEDWSKFLLAVAQRDIDWRTTGFFSIHEKGSGTDNLVVPKDLGKLTITREGLEFKAASDGTSLVVLPRSFSNCYRWHSLGNSAGTAELIRVNFVQLGVLLRGGVHGLITADLRWGTGADCLAQDVREIYAIGVRSVGTPQALQPQGTLGFFGHIIARMQQNSLRRMLEQP